MESEGTPFARPVAGHRVSTAAWVAVLLLSMPAAHAASLPHRHVPEAVASSKAMGAVGRSERLSLAVGLPLRNQAELEDLLKQIVDPASPNFRHYLTPAQFADQFGPSEEDYQALAQFMRAHGLQVTGTHPNRMLLDVAGGAADIETTFHVNLVRWLHAERGTFFAPDREPSVDAGVAILDITGLDNFVVPHPMNLMSLPLSRNSSLNTGSGPGGYFLGNDFRAAYAPGVTLNGAGQTVGLFELDGFYASDVPANFKQAGLPAVPTQTVLLNGYNGAPGGANIEVMLDIMMAAYMAPGLSNIIVYEGYNWNDVLNRMATDNLAKQLSSSWCFSPTNATTEQIFKQMIAQGQSLFQASGDSGAYKGWIMPPADDPYVTVVGGTSLTTGRSGGPWQSETTWPGSGGGVSTTWPIPSYQQSVNMAAIGGSTTMRNIPDVALTADIQMYLIQNSGQAVIVGGTSAAAPLWAGFMALANQQAAANGKPAIGFLNPLIYRIGSGSSLQTDLHDITTGNNRGFTAVSGYDLATGWGTPAGQGLINDLTGLSNPPSFSLSSSAFTLAVAPGTTGTDTISIDPQNGFSGAVSLAVSGLPTGVTASFSSPSAVTASTLTLTASSSAAGGSSVVTITGTSGSLIGTARLILTVAAPATFTISAKPATVSLLQGSTSISTITVTPQGGFTGTVALAASGLAAGITASFSAVSASGVSLMTLTAASSAAPGASSFFITGTSGSLHTTATIGVTVGAPPAAYTITASPANLLVPQGGSGASTITVVPQNGFNSEVALAVTGLPAGITATVTPAGAAGKSTITFSVGANAGAETTTVTVTASSGANVAKATIAITVAAAPRFTLTASPASVNVSPGGSVASIITVNAQSGFSGAVILSVSGLPAGVTSAFNSSTATARSTLTLSATSAAVAGTSMVVVAGTSGSLTSKVTIALTVTPPPSFTLSATPANLNIVLGAIGLGAIGETSAATISIIPQGGFNGLVALGISALPNGVTATFNPASAAVSSLVTFSAVNTVAPGVYPVTITGTAGALTGKVVMTLTIAPSPAFTLVASPTAFSIQQGATVTSMLTVTPKNGFTGTVAVNVSALPGGVVGTVSAGPARSSWILTVAATAAATPGSGTITITAKSGAVSQTATFALTVLAPGTRSALVNMASLYNVSGLVTDSSTFISGGLDGGGRAYSANLLGPVQNINGTPFSLGPPNAPGAVSNATVPLPAGQYSTLKLLAAGVNANQPAQNFIVTYTDGTTERFTQSLSDWCAPQSYAGESKAIPMPYRDNSDGTRDTRPLALYGYSFNLSSGKTASTLTLPKNRNVVVLAISLITAPSAPQSNE